MENENNSISKSLEKLEKKHDEKVKSDKKYWIIALCFTIGLAIISIIITIIFSNNEIIDPPPDETTSSNTSTITAPNDNYDVNAKEQNTNNYVIDDVIDTVEQVTSTQIEEEEKYISAINYIQEENYKSAFSIFKDILNYKDVIMRLYDLAIDRENFKDYYIASDIYRFLANLSYQDSRSKFDYLINNILPIEFFVGIWNAEDAELDYELIVYRDDQDNYYANLYHKPKESNPYVSHASSIKCSVTYDEYNTWIKIKRIEWIDYPQDSNDLLLNLDELVFTKISETEIMSYKNVTFTQQIH